MNKLEEKLKTAPETFGCYLMKNDADDVIYVGKAINLKKRINQYFKGAHDYKTTKLVSEIADFDFIVASSEKEALILEYNLIKKYHPKYNIIFMDDKSYPYIAISNEKYFTVKVVRMRKKANLKAKFFGPYPNVLAANKTVDLINKLFPIRKCKKIPKEVCLYFHLKQCLGYCVREISEETNEIMKKKIIKLLNGDVKEIIEELIFKRNEASDKLNFEYAKNCQELIESINYVVEKQTIEINANCDIDVFDYYLKDQYLVICLLNIRKGKLLNKLININILYNDLFETLSSYIVSYYQKNIDVDEIIIRDKEVLEYIQPIFENTKIIIPKKFKRKELLSKAYENAKEYFIQQSTIIENKTNYFKVLKNNFFKLFKKDIRRIEIFDNSHLFGSDTVSAMVVYEDFKPLKSAYRKYKLNDSGNDLASMYEVLYRRYFKVLKNRQKICDLLIVDGGRMQIDVAKKVMNELGLSTIIIGLSKDEKHNTSYLIDENHEVINIEKNSKIFHFLSNLQDEVHRFVLSYHNLLQNKNLLRNSLLEIDGVGNQTISKLYKFFGSYKKIKEASIEELNKVTTLKISENIYNYFRGKHVRDLE